MIKMENERLATLEQKTDDIKNDVAEIKDTLKNLSKNLVTQQEFRPVKALVYGFVGMLLIAMVTIIFVNPLSNHNQSVTITTQNPDGSTTTKIVPVGAAGTTTGTTTSPSGQTSETPGTTVNQTNTPSNPQPTQQKSFLQSILPGL